MKNLNLIISTEIYEYMVSRLAEGVYISEENEKEMIQEIKSIIETS